MAIQVKGNGGVVAEVDGSTFRAQRVALRPVDYGSLGAYSASAISGTMAAGLAADSEIVQFRWTHATNLCAVMSITLDGLAGSATAFTAGFGKVALIGARTWTADGSGGNTTTLTTNNGKLRTSMGTTLAGAMRSSSTAALTVGTKTLDGTPLGIHTLSFGTVVSVIYAGKVSLFDWRDAGHHPLILATQEGFVLTATVPATGTWQFGATVRWAEVTAY